MIGAARYTGAMQADLAAKLKIANRNFFYVCKVRWSPRLLPLSTARGGLKGAEIYQITPPQPVCS
jgi:hypothetical protein